MRFAVPNYLSNSIEGVAKFGTNIAEAVQQSLVPTRYGTTISSLGPVVKNVGRFVKSPAEAVASVVSSGITDADRQLIWRYTNPSRAATTAVGRATQTLGPAASAVAQKLAPIGLMYTAGQLGPLSQGFRPAGYKSIIPVSKEEDPTGRTSISAPLEAALRYTTLGGRSQLLPYSTFKEERPDVLPSTYTAYRRYEFAKPKPGELVSVNPADKSFTTTGGLIRGTARGLNDPEIRIKGTPITASGVLGTVAGVGASRAVVAALTPRNPEYTKQVEAVQKLKLQQNELANAMASQMDIIRSAAKERNVRVPTRPGLEIVNPNDVINEAAFEKAIENIRATRIAEGLPVKPRIQQTELFPKPAPLSQEEKVSRYLGEIKKVSTAVGQQQAGEEYSAMFKQVPQLQKQIVEQVEKQGELRKTLEPNFIQSNKRALGLAAGIGTAVLVGAAAKKLFAKAEERRVKKENPVEYLKYKHGDLTTAAQALGQPQARSWQELTPYVK